MRIDTAYQGQQTVVVITPTNAKERELTDHEWKRVAFNQHKLQFRGNDGTAVLPRRMTGVMPPEDTHVVRCANAVLVFIPLDK